MEHPLNRHLFIADNLNLLQRLDNESVDLICIDPPFSKNQTFTGTLQPPLTDAERDLERATMAGWGVYRPADAARAGIEWPDADNRARFSDMWRWENDVREDWMTRIEDDYPALAKVIDAARYAHSEGMAAYLCYMAIRIVEMHRILKASGSVYLHCDATAGAYLKSVIDALFGADNFRGEITWKRTSTHSDAKNWAAVSDTIFYYSKSSGYVWNRQYGKYDEQYVTKHYRRDDNDGKGLYRLADIASPNPRPNLMYEWQGYAPPPKGWRFSKATMAKLDREGRIWHPDSKQKRPQVKRYLNEMPGRIIDNTWSDILPVQAHSNERTGYPTQKPVALAERIILASSNPGDVVLDCFAGCAYVPVAAERNGRQWIACDLSPRALTVLRRQFAKFRYAVDGAQSGAQPALITDANVVTRSPYDLPERSDRDPSERPDLRELPERKYKVPSSIIPEREMLEYLLGLSGYMAWCCGFANRRPNGIIVATVNNFHLDHIDPKSKDGSNQIWNRAPLCPAHNVRKNNRRVHLADYRQEIADAGEMLVDSVGDLINLAWAQQQAVDYYASVKARMGE